VISQQARVVGSAVQRAESLNPKTLNPKTATNSVFSFRIHFAALSFDRNHFTHQLTKRFAMNTLNKNIKISVLFSLIAIGATLAGCASRSSKPASTDSAPSAPASSTASDSAAVATQGATTTGNASGQAPINWDDLSALMKKDALSTPPAAQ